MRVLVLALVVQMVDITIHFINRYRLLNSMGFGRTFPMDSINFSFQ